MTKMFIPCVPFIRPRVLFKIELYPWTVSIQHKDDGSHHCGGFIVTMDDGKGRAWVATSASCIAQHYAPYWTVRDRKYFKWYIR